MTLAYLGIGSNLGDRDANIRRALELLGRIRGIRVLRISSTLETDPVEMEEAAPRKFLNAAAEIDTHLEPRELLSVLKRIEKVLGRGSATAQDAAKEARRHRSRTMDLDILLYGDRVVREGDLVIPHSRMPERSFVLDPLAELCPKREVPGTGRTVLELRDAVRRQPKGAAGGRLPPAGWSW